MAIPQLDNYTMVRLKYINSLDIEIYGRGMVIDGEVFVTALVENRPTCQFDSFALFEQPVPQNKILSLELREPDHLHTKLVELVKRGIRKLSILPRDNNIQSYGVYETF
jgi:hypothetical protein